MLRPNSTGYPRSDMIQPSELDGPPAVTFTTITSQDARSHWMNPEHKNELWKKCNIRGPLGVEAWNNP